MKRNAAPTAPEHLGWATDRQLAEHYAVSRMTIWRWAKQGIIPPPEKLSTGTTRWKWEDVK